MTYLGNVKRRLWPKNLRTYNPTVTTQEIAIKTTQKRVHMLYILINGEGLEQIVGILWLKYSLALSQVFDGDALHPHNFQRFRQPIEVVYESHNLVPRKQKRTIASL